MWYAPTSFRVLNHERVVLEEFDKAVDSRGMQFQAFEMERLITEGICSEIIPLNETIAIMEALDAIQEQVGLLYPGEPA